MTRQFEVELRCVYITSPPGVCGAPAPYLYRGSSYCAGHIGQVVNNYD